jgi:hypothetical protein
MQVLFPLPRRGGLIQGRERLLDGTIAALRVAQGTPPDWKRASARSSIPELTRIGF